MVSVEPAVDWVQELGDEPSLTVRTAILITFSFLYLFVASGLLGAAFGLTAALLLKASPDIHVHQAHASLTPLPICQGIAPQCSLNLLLSCSR